MIGRAAALAGLLAAAGLLSGCIAAAIPVAAGAMIGRKEIAKRRERPAEAFPSVAAVAAAPAPAGVTITPLRAPPTPRAAAVVPVAAPSAGEAAAQSFQMFIALRNHMAATARLRTLDVEPDGVVLTPGATIADPEFYACQGKPLAVVFDVDGAVLAGDAAVPGAREAVEAARKVGINVVFSADRPAADEAATRAALARAGLGDAQPGATLWLRGPVDGPGKDARRLEIAKRYCVIAQVGNDLGDFSDLVARGGDAALSPQIAQLWGAGWFVLPMLPPTTTGPAAPVQERP